MATTTTGIEWTDRTWNPVRGCRRVSAGCEHCYAETLAHRFSGPGQPYEGLTRIVNGTPHWTGDARTVEKALAEPLSWRKPARIFVNSMSDLFHEDVPDEFIDQVFAVMASTPWHTYQVLTKRPTRMKAYFEERFQYRRTDGTIGWQGRHARIEYAIDRMDWSTRDPRWWDEDDSLKAINNLAVPFPNVWLGVSVEHQQAADERIPLLLQTPAAVRFLSCEPLLGPVDVEHYLGNVFSSVHGGFGYGIDWVIVGGESGAGARPMHPDWARSLRDQCAAAGVPFFFKQWGEWEPGRLVHQGNGKRREYTFPSSNSWIEASLIRSSAMHHLFDDEMAMRRVGVKRAGHLLDRVEHRAFPGGE